MLFNSYEYLLLFLPIALIGYVALARHSRTALVWLCAASLFFYGWWNPLHLVVIIGSIALNFGIARRIIASTRHARTWLWLGIFGNLALLGLFKYTHFVLGVAGLSDGLPAMALPLGISFFTFTQIAYLVDTARGEVKETNPIFYTLFVTFFPHLLAGPIIHHKEMMPQFADASRRFFNADNVARGLFLLALGLGKKVLIADPLGLVSNAGYANIAALDAQGAWFVTLAYTFQLYFDFSGYTDMALGAALMFNITLPINFNSPYRATTIQDFWRRWHITLSRFLRDYLYIPLGGNRQGKLGVAVAIFTTFVLGGLWHGAGWTFILWGAAHGLALIAFRLWQQAGKPLPIWLSWLLTFLFVHLSWVFFRAGSLADAMLMFKKLIPNLLLVSTMPTMSIAGGTLIIAIVITAWPRNSNHLAQRFAARWWESAISVGCLVAGVLTFSQVTQFLYFNF